MYEIATISIASLCHYFSLCTAAADEMHSLSR